MFLSQLDILKSSFKLQCEYKTRRSAKWACIYLMSLSTFYYVYLSAKCPRIEYVKKEQKYRHFVFLRLSSKFVCRIQLYVFSLAARMLEQRCIAEGDRETRWSQCLWRYRLPSAYCLIFNLPLFSFVKGNDGYPMEWKRWPVWSPLTTRDFLLFARAYV